MSNFHFAEKLQKLCFFPVFCYILLHILCRPSPNDLISITDLDLNILGVTSGVTNMSKFKMAEKWPKTLAFFPVFCYIIHYILCRLLPNDLISIPNLGLLPSWVLPVVCPIFIGGHGTIFTLMTPVLAWKLNLITQVSSFMPLFIQYGSIFMLKLVILG